jgi:hypothetical protein
MEIPMLLIVASKYLPQHFNRPINLFFALLLIVVQAGSLLGAHNSLHYLFFSAVEIGTLCCILWVAWNWRTLPSETATAV